MNSRRPLPLALNSTAFRVIDAFEAGVSRNRLRAQDLTATFWGARTTGADPVRALLPLMTPEAAFCGPTSAKLWDLPLPSRWWHDTQLHVSCRGNHRMRRAGVVSSRREHSETLTLHGIPVLSPVMTWISLAGLLTRDDLTAVADRLVTGTLKTPALATLTDLDAILETLEGGRWIRHLRSARGDVRIGAWSRPETLLRLLIVRAGLPEPALNLPFWLDRGRRVYLDLAWPEYLIAIEYDGHWHFANSRGVGDDDRHERLVDAGWLVIRVRAADLFDRPSALVARLVARLRERGFALDHPIEESRMVTVPR